MCTCECVCVSLHVCVCVQCKEGGFPHDLWLSVSAENVSVYKRGESRPLETFPYEHIIFFGAPQPNTYKITVDEREMFFETRQVRFLFNQRIRIIYVEIKIKKQKGFRLDRYEDKE